MRIVSVAVLVTLLVGVCFARVMGWDLTKRPNISIVDGHEKALKVLGDKAERFYCVSARLAITRREDGGDWLYRFSSESRESRWVYVYLNGKTKMLDHPPAP